jgi:aspartate 1-decarboxylase
VPRSTIERIRERIRYRQYDMSAHAMEEMAEDELDIVDVEHVVLHGAITRIERNDPRGTKYVIEGIAAAEPRLVGVAGRFMETGRYLIITVYALTDEHEDF